VVGSAADIAKSALLYADQKLAALGVEARILLMIHDEIIWEVKDSTHSSLTNKVRRSFLRIRIRKFLGLLDPDPDPLVRGTDPDPAPSIFKQK
jgi:hypothetical protein